MTLDFTPNNDYNLDLLATGSRDRLIKLFDVSKAFALILTLDEHTSSITHLKFAYPQESNKLILISASLDRSIIFREYPNDQNKKLLQIYHQEIEKTNKLLSLELTHNHNTLYLGYDKKISLFNTTTGKFKKVLETKDQYKINTLENHKLALDCTGSFIAICN